MRQQVMILGSISPPQQITAPPRTISEAVSQCRSAFRNFRQLKSDAKYTIRKAEGKPYHATIELPLPAKRSLLNPFSDDPEGKRIRVLDQGEWPGGIVQQYRALRPLIDSVLDGYGGEFVGMLGAAEDGMGVWKMDDTTLTCNVINLTFAQFAKLCTGEFGSRPLDPEHTIMVVNPGWTSSKDIGQFWDRKLKEQAKEIVDDAHWEMVYCCRPLRTSQGACGILVRSFPHPWRLYPTPADDADVAGDCILESAEEPEEKVISQLLNKEWPDVQRQFSVYLKERDRARGKPW